MDLRRARIGEWLSGGLGAALVLSLFLPWYCLPDSRSECARGEGVSAWEAFAVVDVMLLAAAATAVAALVLTLTQRTPAVPLAVTSLGVFVALAAAVLAVARLVAAPDLGGADGDAAPVRLLGSWLGAAAAVGLLAALLAAVRDERIPSEGRTADQQAAAVPPSRYRDRRSRETPGGPRDRRSRPALLPLRRRSTGAGLCEQRPPGIADASFTGRSRALHRRNLQSRVVIGREQVLHVARLARLDLTEPEVERMANELSGVLDHIERIAELDLDHVEPTSHVVALENVLRADEPRPSLGRERALAGAPDATDSSFRVPSPGAVSADGS